MRIEHKFVSLLPIIWVTNGLCFAAGLPGARAAEYLSNLGNKWVDPGNPTCNCSIGDIHSLGFGYDPFTVQFFTGVKSAETNNAALNAGETVVLGTNSISVAAFELNSVTFEFIWGHAQPWSNANVEVYQQTGNESILVGQLGTPAVNPMPTQWPESANPRFCTTYVDYFPLKEIVLQPSSEYSLVLTEASTPSPLGLLFSLSSNFVTATDWRMGITATHDPWAAGEFLKVGIAGTAVLQTNSLNDALGDVRLSATMVGTNLVLSWPTFAPVCHLYAVPRPQATSWSAVPTQPLITNGSYMVTLPLNGPGCFFRLQTQ